MDFLTYVDMDEFFGVYPHQETLSLSEFLAKLEGAAKTKLNIKSPDEVVIGLDLDVYGDGKIHGFYLVKKTEED